MMTTREWAEIYVNLELPIIPLCSHNHAGMSSEHKSRCKTPGKVPLLKQWSNHMSTDMGMVEEWLGRNPGVNIGLVLGETDNHNIVGVDIDGEKGLEVWEGIKRDKDVPESWEFKSGSGYRVLYALPLGVQSKKTKVFVSKEHNEVALICSGQQTVLPPSMHHSGALYEWIIDPLSRDIAMAPQWIIDLVQVQPSSDPTEPDKIVMSAPVTLPEAMKKVEVGNRSNTLVRMIGSWAATGTMPVESLLGAAKAYNASVISPPLTDAEVQQAVDYVYDREASKIAKKNDKRRTRELDSPSVLAAELLTLQANEGRHYRFRQTTEQLYTATTARGPWRPVSDSEMERMIHHFLDSNRGTDVNKSQMWGEVRKQIGMKCNPEGWNDDALDMGRYPIHDTICVINGILSWKEPQLLSWDVQSCAHTLGVNAYWDEFAGTSEEYKFWTNLVRSWVADDAAAMFLQEFVGYALTPKGQRRALVFLHGSGRNGKSMFLETINELFKGYTTQVSLGRLTERFGTAHLLDKMWAVCADSDEKYIAQTGTLKSLANGEVISSEIKGGAIFDLYPTCKLVFATNHLPRVADKSTGWTSRMKIVEFPHTFAEDTKFYDNVKRVMYSDAGKSALLYWAVEGLRRIEEQNGFTEGEAMKLASRGYQVLNDSVLRFSQEQFAPSPEYYQGRREKLHECSLHVQDTYHVYKSWCEFTGIKPISQEDFIRSLKSYGAYDVEWIPTKVLKVWKKQRCIIGWSFKNDDVDFDGKTMYDELRGMIY